MKKLATVLTAIVMLLTSTAFALSEEDVSTTVKSSFKTDFSSAKKVSWEKVSDFYFASFTLDNVNVDAAYNEAGELVGTSRKIEVSQLPLAVSLSLSQQFGDYTVSPRVNELTYDGSTCYYITAGNDKQVVKLKCHSNGEINVDSRVKNRG